MTHMNYAVVSEVIYITTPPLHGYNLAEPGQ